MSVKQKTIRRAPKTAWKPGTSGNPQGRPPGERALANALRGIVDPIQYAQVLWDMARGNDSVFERREPSLPALREIAERLEGRAWQALDPDTEERLAKIEERLNELQKSN